MKKRTTIIFESRKFKIARSNSVKLLLNNASDPKFLESLQKLKSFFKETLEQLKSFNYIFDAEDTLKGFGDIFDALTDILNGFIMPFGLFSIRESKHICKGEAREDFEKSLKDFKRVFRSYFDRFKKT